MQTITLTRACEAAKVPGGEKVTLPAGARVELVQTLGGYTVKAEPWGMVRIPAGEADALGLRKEAAAPAAGVTLSEFAAQKLREVRKAEGKEGWGVRVSALPGGSGYTFQMDFEQSPGPGDVVGEQHGFTVFYSREQAALLEGVSIDYREGSGGAGFVMRAPKRAPKGRGRDAPEGSLERKAWDELRKCFDPEIPINIVDLGLIYSLSLSPLPEGGHEADVEMTLTSPGCAVGPMLVEDVRQKLLSLPEVRQANVQLVFDPPWSKGMMSEAARLQLDL